MRSAASLPPLRAQAELLIALGAADRAGIPAHDLRRAADREVPNALLAIHPSRAPASMLAPLVTRGDKRGFVVADMVDVDEFVPIPDATMPGSDVYLVTDLDRGDALSNWTPNDALPEILADGRTPLTLTEGLLWVLHQPGVLERNRCFMTVGSRCTKGNGMLDSRTPAIWISNGTGRDGAANRGAPKVGWCWAGNRHTWLGFASAADRHPHGVRHTHELDIGTDVVRKIYVSAAQGEPDREWAALQLLHSRAPDLAPRPLSRCDVDSAGRGRPALVMSRVPGHPLTGLLSDEQTLAFAEALRRLFAVPIPEDFGARANDPTGFSTRIRAWLARAGDFPLCQDPALVRAAIAAARLWLDRNPIDVEWIVDPVVSLGDGNLDNVMWDGAVCRIVDWEECGVSDLAYEVAGILEHASSRLERRLDGHLLLAGLCLSDAQRARVEHYRPLFAAFWLAMLLPGNGAWQRNPRGSTEDQARHVLRLLDRYP